MIWVSIFVCFLGDWLNIKYWFSYSSMLLRIQSKYPLTLVYIAGRVPVHLVPPYSIPALTIPTAYHGSPNTSRYKAGPPESPWQLSFPIKFMKKKSKFADHCAPFFFSTRIAVLKLLIRTDAFCRTCNSSYWEVKVWGLLEAGEPWGGPLIHFSF